jgi:hypothetical protein
MQAHETLSDHELRKELDKQLAKECIPEPCGPSSQRRPHRDSGSWAREEAEERAYRERRSRQMQEEFARQMREAEREGIRRAREYARRATAAAGNRGPLNGRGSKGTRADQRYGSQNTNAGVHFDYGSDL